MIISRSNRRRPGLGLAACLMAAPPSAAPESIDGPSGLSGVWSGIYTTPAREGWRVEDFYCPVGCPKATYERLRALLADPANDAVDFETLVARAEAETPALAELLTPEAQARHRAFERDDDPSIRCEPKGLARQVLNPLPLEISVQADRLILRYEQWQAERTIRLEAEADPASGPPTLLGASAGRFEDRALVLETAGVSANILTVDGVPHSDSLRAVERYALSDDGMRLELTLTLHDPVMFRAPIVMTKAWLRTPTEEVLEERCEIISGRP